MSDDDSEFTTVLSRLLKSVEELETQLASKKRLVNELCKEYGRTPRFPDAEAPKAVSLGNLSRDVFYGRPLASVIKEYLEMRGPSNRGGLGAASVNEIHEALIGGGFKFETKDRANAIRGLRIALTKNTTAFHRVGDNYGLAEWYPAASRAAQRASTKSESAKDEEQNGNDELAEREKDEGTAA